MATTAYIGLGSNLGDRAGNLLAGIRGLMLAGLNVNRISRIYETEPVETFPQPLFLNMVCEVNGAIPPPEELVNRLLSVEAELGRTRDVSGGPRTLDLDLLFYGDEIRETSDLQLPHPRLHQRRFVLEPLAELAPTLVHPKIKLSVSELLAALKDDSAVRIWQP